MLRKLFWKQKEDKAPEKADEQNDKEGLVKLRSNIRIRGTSTGVNQIET